MKNIILAISAILLLTSCTKIDGANPSQNKALNAVAGKTEKKDSGYMQKALDKWVKEDWTPAVEQNDTVKKQNEDESRNFTLQEYVDKAALYSQEHNSTLKESHAKKVNSMPVIGKVN